MRQQLVYFTRPLRRQACQHVLQVGIRIVPVVPSRLRLDQTHDRGGAFTAAQRPCKEPVLAPQRPRAYLVLAPIIINEQRKQDDRLIGQLHCRMGHGSLQRMEMALPGPTLCQGRPSIKA